MSDDSISTVIGEIYEAAYRPGRWLTVIENLVKLSNADSGGLFIQDKYIKEADGFYSYGLSEQTLVDYSRFGRDDPSWKIMTCKPIGEAVNIHGPDKLEDESPDFYKQVRVKHDIGFVCGTNILITDQQHVGLGLQRSASKSPFDEEALRLLNALTPHLQRAFTIQREFLRLRLKERAMTHCLDGLLMGVVLFDQFGTQVYSNAIAESIISEHPALQYNGDSFTPTNPKDASRMHSLIFEIIRQAQQGRYNSVELMGIHHPGEDHPLIIMIKSVDRTEFDDALGDEPAFATLYLSDPQRCLPLNPEALKALFDLSRSESKVAVALANGMSVAKIAETTNRSLNTVRSHLKSLFKKTSTNSQAELVQKLLRNTVSAGSVPE